MFLHDVDMCVHGSPLRTNQDVFGSTVKLIIDRQRPNLFRWKPLLAKELAGELLTDCLKVKIEPELWCSDVVILGNIIKQSFG
jgi:hypothetical protein